MWCRTSDAAELAGSEGEVPGIGNELHAGTGEDLRSDDAGKELLEEARAGTKLQHLTITLGNVFEDRPVPVFVDSTEERLREND